MRGKILRNKINSYIIYSSLFLIVFTSLSGVLLLALRQYSASLSLSLGFLLSILITLLLRKYLPIVKVKVDYLLILLLLVAFALRYPAMNYIEGGQDQGIYPAISKMYDRTGGVYEKDVLRDSLSEEGKEDYDETDQRVIALQRYNIEESEFLFPFYPVNPIWLSISAFIFGEPMRSFSLTFFSILSIIGVYLLSSSVFKNRIAGIISASVLTVLPIHVYFSKLPVTEIPSLAFILFAFYFLHQYYVRAKKGSIDGTGEKDNEHNYWGLLVISSLLFITFFFTRISGLLYIPFFGLLALLAIEFTKGIFKRNLLLYFLVIFLGFFLSLIYYYNVIPYLFWHFYIDFFTKKQLEEVTLVFALIPILFCIYNRYFEGRLRKLILWITNNFGIVVKFVFALIVLASIHFAYKMGFTDTYIGTVYDVTWKMAGKGLSVFKDLSLTSIVAHLGPFIALPLFIVMFIKKKFERDEVFLYTFFLFFLLFTTLVTRFITHHYYFSRYQLTEVIPFAVLIFSGIMYKEIQDTRKWVKGITILIFITSLTYFGVYTSVLFNGPMGNDSRVYETVVEEIGQENLNRSLVLYFDPKGFPISFTLTPLRHYFGVNTYVIKALEDINTSPVTELINNFENRYLISTVRLESIEGIDVVGNNEFIVQIEYAHMFYGASSLSPKFPLDFTVSGFDIPMCTKYAGSFSHYCGGIIPSKYHEGKMTFYFYLLK